MVAGNFGFQLIALWAAKTARMGQLQADEQIVAAAELLSVRGFKCPEQRGQTGTVRRGRLGLARICATLGHHRGRFAAPN